MNDFFTTASFTTLAGCVAAVIVIFNTLRHVTNWGPRWFAFVLSIVISILAFILTKESTKLIFEEKNSNLIQYLIVLLNGCFIYTSAFGIQNTTINKLENKNLEFQSVENSKLKWSTKW